MKNSDAPVVSVVIPFYGSVDMLRHALQSVRDQTFLEQIEAIVVVDGSDEDLSSVRDDFPEIELIHQENAGAGVARNRGIESSRGVFIAFLDADDRWLPTKLAVQVEAMRRTGAEWCQHSYLAVSPKMDILRHVDTSHLAGDVLRDSLLSFRIQTSTVMVRRECLQDPSLRFSADRMGEDGHFYIQMAMNYPLAAVPESLGCFTWHGANVGGRADAQLWSRARIWDLSSGQVRASLPRSGQIAYRWCAMAARILRYPRESPPRNRSHAAALIAYSPSYLVFQLLARRPTR